MSKRQFKMSWWAAGIRYHPLVCVTPRAPEINTSRSRSRLMFHLYWWQTDERTTGSHQGNKNKFLYKVFPNLHHKKILSTLKYFYHNTLNMCLSSRILIRIVCPSNFFSCVGNVVLVACVDKTNARDHSSGFPEREHLACFAFKLFKRVSITDYPSTNRVGNQPTTDTNVNCIARYKYPVNYYFKTTKQIKNYNTIMKWILFECFTC